MDLHFVQRVEFVRHSWQAVSQVKQVLPDMYFPGAQLRHAANIMILQILFLYYYYMQCR